MFSTINQIKAIVNEAENMMSMNLVTRYISALEKADLSIRYRRTTIEETNDNLNKTVAELLECMPNETEADLEDKLVMEQRMYKIKTRTLLEAANVIKRRGVA